MLKPYDRSTHLAQRVEIWTGGDGRSARPPWRRGRYNRNAAYIPCQHKIA